MTSHESLGATPPASPLKLNREEILGRVRRNLLIIVSGKSLAFPLGLLALSLNARALGPSDLGILSLILSYSLVLNRVCEFNTWQPLIKLGSVAHAEGRTSELSGIIALSFALDATTALAAAALGAGLFLHGGNWIGIPGEYLTLAALYSATKFTMIAGTPTGVVRLLDKFHLVTACDLGVTIGQTAASIVLFLADASLAAYICAFAAVDIAKNVSLIALSLGALHRAGIPVDFRHIRAVIRNHGREYWSFAWSTNLASTLNIVRQNADLFLLGAIAGPQSAGVYQIAIRASQVLRRIHDPAQQVIYPEMARLAAVQRSAEVTYYTVRAGIVCCALGALGLLLAWLGGQSLIDAFAGEGYREATAPLTILMLAAIVGLAGVGLSPAVLSTAGPHALLRANAVAFVLFALAAPWSIIQLGILGAGLSQLAFNAVWFSVMAATLRRATRGNTTA
jgi:O-antigen/teichoic acid export membrane protein